MTMSVERFIVSFSVFLWILLKFLSKYWIEAAEGYVIGNRRRIDSVARIECILTVLNVFAYGQLMRWFDDDIVKEKALDRRRMQVIWGG
ncbi:unnamed protein product [Caenorhabditis sp. 36 PRJEB53466]|nr:unnamed protein product [Caenorhabditis sp. 36 PRJEB53466]